MNNWFGIGRLTKDPELKFTNGDGIAVATFTIAIDRNYNKGEEKVADFINVVCWRKLAEIVANHLKKGSQVAVTGMLQSKNYTATDGHKVYAHEIVADEVKFLASPTDGKPEDSQD